MFRYEEHLAREQKLNFSNEQWEKIWMVSPSESIEHIWRRVRRLTNLGTGSGSGASAAEAQLDVAG